MIRRQIYKKSIFVGKIYLGGVAQMARAFDWQSRGRGFDSHLLH